MNKTINNMIRQLLIDLLKECTEPQQQLFKRMYSHSNLGLPIEVIVENMAESKLDWAVTQVEKTLNKT